MILDLFSLVIRHLLLLASRKSSNACLALVLNAEIAAIASGTGGGWMVVIFAKIGVGQAMILSLVSAWNWTLCAQDGLKKFYSIYHLMGGGRQSSSYPTLWNGGVLREWRTPFIKCVRRSSRLDEWRTHFAKWISWWLACNRSFKSNYYYSVAVDYSLRPDYSSSSGLRCHLG